MVMKKSFHYPFSRSFHFRTRVRDKNHPAIIGPLFMVVLAALATSNCHSDVRGLVNDFQTSTRTQLLGLTDWLSDTTTHPDYTQTELFQDGYVDVQWFDGYQGYTVDPTGQQDSTAGIQAAIDEVFNGYPPSPDDRSSGLPRFVLLFTHQPDGRRGEYLISDYLNCRQDSSRGNKLKNRHALVGELSANNERPLIKLGDNSPSYQNANSPRPMLWFWSMYLSEYPDGSDPTRNDWDVHMNQEFRGIDLDLGAGNRGAVGLDFKAAEGSNIEDVTINARDGIAGIGDLSTYGGFAVNIEIINGDYAIKNFNDVLQNQQATRADHGFIQTLAGSRFINQREAVIDFDTGQQGYFMLVGSLISNTGSIPLNYRLPNDSSAGFVLERCIVEMGADTTLIQNDSGRNIVIRDTYTKGIDTIISGGSAAIANTSDYAHIKEFSRPGNNYFSFIDGEVTGDVTKNIEEGISHPRPDLINSLVNVAKWDELSFPSYWRSHAGGTRDSEVLNARTECISVAGLASNVPIYDEGDATAALQAAIDWAAANNKILFIPRGRYRLTAPITLRANSKIIGIGKDSSILQASYDWHPTTETPIVRTENNANSTAVLAFISIRNYTPCLGDHLPNSRYLDTHSHVNFTNLDWQLGGGSQVRNVGLSLDMDLHESAGRYWCNGGNFFRYSRAKVSNHGGGRWWNITPGYDRSMRSESTSIPFYIKDTDQPLYLYGWDGHARGDGFYGDIKIENSSNKYIYNNVHEATCTGVYIEGSTNVVHMGTRQNNQPPSIQARPAPYEGQCSAGGVDAQKVITDHNGKNSENVFISNVQIYVRPDACDYYLIKETYNSTEFNSGLTRQSLCVLKRGDAAYAQITSATACSDGTALNSCVVGLAPRYCNASAQLVDNCHICGCRNNWTCLAAGSCQADEHAVCADGPEYCTDKTDCDLHWGGSGYVWNPAALEGTGACVTKDPGPDDTCATHPALCTTRAACETQGNNGAGWYWWSDGVCSFYPQSEEDHLEPMIGGCGGCRTSSGRGYFAVMLVMIVLLRLWRKRS